MPAKWNPRCTCLSVLPVSCRQGRPFSLEPYGLGQFAVLCLSFWSGLKKNRICLLQWRKHLCTRLSLLVRPKKNRFVSCSGENTCEHVSPRPSLLTGEKKIQCRCNTHIHTPLCIPAGKAGTLCIDLCVYSCSSEDTSISPPLVCVASRYFEYKPSFSL